MGVFDFLSSVGEKLTGGPSDEAAAEQRWRQAALKNVPAKLGLPVTDFDVALEGDAAVITGKVPSREVAEKIVLAIGNTAGIGKVDDRLEVAAAAAPATIPEPGSTDAAAPATAASDSAAAPAAEAPAVFYTVKKGDNLSSIAKEHYGAASKYMLIFEANKPMLTHPDKIYVGQVLRIPPKP